MGRIKREVEGGRWKAGGGRWWRRKDGDEERMGACEG